MSSSSFRLFLPSNASADTHPTNTASCFTTDLKTPLRLNGDWEVGVDSICYNTNIGDVDETGTVHSTYSTFTSHILNNEYPTKYKVLANNKWDYSRHRMKHTPSLILRDSGGKEKIRPTNDVGSELMKAMTQTIPTLQADPKQPAVFSYWANVQYLQF